MLYNSRKENIRKYIGDENMPGEEDFKQILGKVNGNVFVRFLKVIFSSTTSN